MKQGDLLIFFFLSCFAFFPPCLEGKVLKSELFAKRNHMHYQFTAVGTTGLYQMETPISVYLLKDDLMNFLPVLHCLNIYKLLWNLGCNRSMWEFLSLTEECLKDYWPCSSVWGVTYTNFDAAPPTNHMYLK